MGALGRFKSDKMQVKDIEAFIAENAEAFTNAGYGKQQKQRKRSHSESEVHEKNPMRDGQRMKCFFCDSEYHIKPNCEKYKSWKERAEKERRQKGKTKERKMKGRKMKTEGKKECL